MSISDAESLIAVNVGNTSVGIGVFGRFGVLQVPGPGDCQLTLRPLDAGGAAVRIAGLTLIPAG